MPKWLKAFGWFVVVTFVTGWLTALGEALGLFHDTPGQIGAIFTFVSKFFTSLPVIILASFLAGFAAGVASVWYAVAHQRKELDTPQSISRTVRELTEIAQSRIQSHQFNDRYLIGKIDILNQRLKKLGLETVTQLGDDKPFSLIATVKFYENLRPYLEAGDIGQAREKNNIIARGFNTMTEDGRRQAVRSVIGQDPQLSFYG